MGGFTFRMNPRNIKGNVKGLSSNGQNGGSFGFDLHRAKNHVLSFLHIQKAGGTYLEKRLVTDIDGLGCNCSKEGRHLSCRCLRGKGDPWVIMRYVNFGQVTGWPCGLHPDLAMLSECIPKLLQDNLGEDYSPEIHFFTILRNPVARYVSEFRHVQRGATWQNANVKCKRDSLCYEGENWSDVTLNDFMKCKQNPANNRQIQMLADLPMTCSELFAMSKEEQDALVYKSATVALRKMIFFAILEKPAESQFIFEKTFNVKFKNDWTLFDTGYSKQYMRNLSKADIANMERVNHLDMKLYKYALALFAKRLAHFEKISQEKPKKLKIVENKKSKDVLDKNWKNKNSKTKMKQSERKKRARKRRMKKRKKDSWDE